MGFEDSIEIIVVDDGSTDRSPEVIEKWRLRYPKNIVCLRQSNAGVAEARNKGLLHVHTPWVTFIDSDDFVRHDYFEQVAKGISHYDAKIALISCNVIGYDEATGRRKKLPIMLERFDGSDAPLDLLMKPLAYLFRVNSVFFRTDIIQRFDLRFDPRIRPHFEDVEYVNRYLCFAGSFMILPLTRAKYYYREREAGTSLMDRCWRDPDKFGVILTAGYLGLLNLYRQKFDRVPRFVEDLVLGEILGYLVRFRDCDDRLSFMSYEESVAFEAKLAAVLELIGIDTILQRDGVSHSDKVGLLTRFKDTFPPEQTVRVDRIDPDSNLIKLCFYDDGSSHVEIQLDERIVTPSFERTIVHTFNRRPFVTERIFWVEADESSTLAVAVNGCGAKLTLLENNYSVLTATDVKLASRLQNHVASGHSIRIS